MKNINLLHVTFAYYPYMNLGGVPRAVYDLVRIQKDKYNVTIVTNIVDKRCFENQEDINVIYLQNLSSELIYKYQFYTPIPNSKLFTAIRDSDIIHFHGHRNLLNDLVFYISAFFKKPYIVTTHGTLHNYESKKLIKGLYDKITGDRFISGAENIIVHSNAERAKLVVSGIDSDKIKVIPNGIFFEDLTKRDQSKKFFEKYGIGGDKRVILFLGKITKRKGLEVSLEAFNRIIDEKLKFVIAGEIIGDCLKEIKTNNKIKYIGYLNQEEKVSAILSSEFLLYPSIYEAFGYVPFEAFYLGKPCIIGDDFGTSEYLSPVVPELVVSYGDSIELSEVMLRILKDDKFKEDVVNRGREYVINEFSVYKMADKYDDVYKSILL